MNDLPRVTEILRAVGLGPAAQAPPGRIEKAMKRGRAVHEIIEGLAYGYLESNDVPARLEGYILGYTSFLADTQAVHVVSEYEVRNEKLGYRGHIDLVCQLFGRRTVVDWKTGTSVDLAATELQLAAYRMAWEHERPKETVQSTLAVQLPGDGRYKIHEADTSAETQARWIAALSDYHERTKKA